MLRITVHLTHWHPIPPLLTICLHLFPHQVLRLLKQQIDAELPINEESFEQIDNSRATLIDREFRLVNSRKNAIEMSKVSGQNISGFSQTSTANISSTTPPQLTPSSSYDPFRRTETNRKGLKNSISNIFRWQKSLSTPGKVPSFNHYVLHPSHLPFNN